MRQNLTTKAIEALKPAPAGTRYDVADAIVPGFAVRVTDKGHKSYVLTARFPGSGNPTRRAISRVGAMELSAARDVARGWLEMIVAGVDPRAERERQRRIARLRPETMRDVGERFLDQHVRRNGLRSASETERIFERYIYPEWGEREFVVIRRGDVARLLDGIEERAPVMADRVLSVLSKLCNWYQAREESYVSPIVRGMRRTRPAERARQRVLSDEEIRLIWKVGGEAGTFGAFVKVALLTGQRRAKVAELQWDDIGPDGTWTIRAEAREKANAQRLKLPPAALEILTAQKRREGHAYVFAGRLDGPINGFSKAKRALDADIAEAAEKPLAQWTVHDLRRTAKSLMARAGVRPDISERVLGHAIAGVEGVYDRHSYDREKTEALKKLAALISRIVAPRSGNVVPVKAAARP